MKKLVLMSVLCTIGLGLLVISQAYAQDVYISRYIPGITASAQDPTHRVELFNESPTEYADLSGYYLLTRYYILKFPANTYIAPMGSLDMGSKQAKGVDLVFDRKSRFSVRRPEGEDEGDYVVLYNRKQEIVDAFYFGKRVSVTFLPSQAQVPDPQIGDILLKAPDESDYRWTFLRNPRDPAMSFVRINGSWRPNDRVKNMVPATHYRLTGTKFVDGIVTLKWKTLFERDCYHHVVERSTDSKHFFPIERLVGPQNQAGAFEYTYYDAEVQEDRVYYYRIANIDKFGNTVYSKVAKVRTQQEAGSFTFDLIQDEVEGAVNVRFSSRREQMVRMKLLDEELRQIDLLYVGDIEAEKQYLVNYTKRLPVGKYYVIVTAEERRYYEPFIVE
ncbi:hypothetical protein [Pontibacter sp. G13]|uniref:hypothetical protein n=1 Tax=Pontibacter sp. G13 TaxID=3074898 RepID=UPI00288A1A63|nr:hypothetical protein [Pontibacter sp. G13]WNJ20901.1 hypothetical protein RJD25_10520 [Pontibacter sp. G13]